jgi:DNA invertase Pin-like site-specific DNA recombinase
MGAGQKVGYVWVSRSGQNDKRQLDGVGLDWLFRDQCTGKDKHRPELQAMLAYLRQGDTLYVHALDHLARNLSDLLSMVRGLVDKGVTVVFVRNNLTFPGTANATDKLLLAMLGAVAEFERDMLREREAEGIALAKARGGGGRGRKPVVKPDMLATIRARLDCGVPKTVIARELGIARATLYAALKQRALTPPRPA